MMEWVEKIKTSLLDSGDERFNLAEVYLAAPQNHKPVMSDLFIYNTYYGVSKGFDAFLESFEYLSVDFHNIYGMSKKYNLASLLEKFSRIPLPKGYLIIGCDCASDPFLMARKDGSIWRLNRREENCLVRLSCSFPDFMNEVLMGNSHTKLFPDEPLDEVVDDWIVYMTVKGWFDIDSHPGGLACLQDFPAYRAYLDRAYLDRHD